MTKIKYVIRDYNGATIGYIDLDKGFPPTKDGLRLWVQEYRRKQGAKRHLPEYFELFKVGTTYRVATYREPRVTYVHYVKIVATFHDEKIKLVLPERAIYDALQSLKDWHFLKCNNNAQLSVSMRRVSIAKQQAANHRSSLQRIVDASQERLKQVS